LGMISRKIFVHCFLCRPAAVYSSVNKLVHFIFVIIIILHQGHTHTVEEKCGVKTILSET